VVNLEKRFTHGGILAALIDLGADWAMIRKTGARRADDRHAPSIITRWQCRAISRSKARSCGMGSQFSCAGGAYL